MPLTVYGKYGKEFQLFKTEDIPFDFFELAKKQGIKLKDDLSFDKQTFINRQAFIEWHAGYSMELYYREGGKVLPELPVYEPLCFGGTRSELERKSDISRFNYQIVLAVEESPVLKHYFLLKFLEENDIAKCENYTVQKLSNPLFVSVQK